MPDWVAQRLWLGTILFAAGAGVLCLLRAVLGLGDGRRPTVAAFVYALHAVRAHAGGPASR